MKNSFLVLIALFTLSFVGCSDDKDEPAAPAATGVLLDQATLEIEKEKTATLVATLEPVGAVGDITWTSSDASVAAVNKGIVTALKVGTTTIAASFGAFSATCNVTVTPKQLDPNDLPASLRGSDYYVINLDAVSSEIIGSKITHDFRPDDTNKFLYIWDNTFAAGTASGLNSYGLAEEWVSLVVGNVGWSGAGYNVGAGFGSIDMTNLFNNPNDYVLHLSVKSAQQGTAYSLIFNDGTAEGKIVIGDVAIEGIEPMQDFTRDNEWQEIEIPVSKLRDLGVFYDKPFSDVNIFAFLAGGVAGTTLDLDAVFFYKKPAQ